jgi:hypothetical protein
VIIVDVMDGVKDIIIKMVVFVGMDILAYVHHRKILPGR